MLFSYFSEKQEYCQAFSDGERRYTVLILGYFSLAEGKERDKEGKKETERERKREKEGKTNSKEGRKDFREVQNSMSR